MRTKVVLFFIIILASFLRLWQLTSLPPGFSADEATIGYNAYAILKTGADEYGTKVPLAFKAFSDYQAPFYTYLTVPFVKFLGLNELAVRLPSAIFGILTVVIVYLLVLRLFGFQLLALLSAFFAAISPYLIFFSRGAWQANLATFFITLGFYFFVVGLENSKYLPFSVLAFIASLYSYQSPRLLVPIIGVFLILFYWKKLWTQKRAILVSFILGLLFFAPIIFILSGTAGQARFKGVSIFSDPGPVNRINQLRGEHSNPNGFLSKVLHNKIQTFAIITIRNHLEHFDKDFLFFKGDPVGRQNVPEMGVTYLFDIILLPLGLIFVFRRGLLDKAKIILLWLAVAPMASAFTFQTPNALRAANMAVPLVIVSSLGAFWLFEVISKRNMLAKIFCFLLIGSILGFSVGKFLHQYFVHLPKQYGLEWESGFGKMINFVKENEDNYQKIIITNRYDQPYILTLFYLKYDPKTYQKVDKQESQIDNFGFTMISSFDKYEFRRINWQEDSKLKDVLLVGTAEEIPKNAPVEKEILFPNGQPAFKIVST